jgi:hypothetical protein
MYKYGTKKVRRNNEEDRFSESSIYVIPDILVSNTMEIVDKKDSLEYRSEIKELKEF